MKEGRGLSRKENDVGDVRVMDLSCRMSNLLMYKGSESRWDSVLV